MIKKTILLATLASLGYASYENGENVFKNKCNSCHSSYIPVEKIKDNFFNQNNKLLNLKAPTINMLVWAITEGPKKIGEDGDDFRKDEVISYLEEALYNPSKENSICDNHIMRYYNVKKSLKGKVSEEDIENLADYILEYKKHRIDATHLTKIKLDAMQNLDDILKKAKRENKLIMIKATSPHCWFCKKMDREVFDDEDIQKLLAKDFILLEVNVDKYKIPYNMGKYYRKVTPSFIVIDGDKNMITNLPGSWGKEDFTDYINENLEKR